MKRERSKYHAIIRWFVIMASAVVIGRMIPNLVSFQKESSSAAALLIDILTAAGVVGWTLLLLSEIRRLGVDMIVNGIPVWVVSGFGASLSGFIVSSSFWYFRVDRALELAPSEATRLIVLMYSLLAASITGIVYFTVMIARSRR